MVTTAPVLAGIELGGTKSIALIGQGDRIIDQVTVPTTTPDATLGPLAAALGRWRATHAPAALGVASFGPVGVLPGRADYGRMLPTPKPGWAGAVILDPLAAMVDGPAMIHTDVTGAALAEQRWGAAVGSRDLVYVTIGTGIGMGIIAGGRAVTGQMHPEAGHVAVRRLPGDDFAGVCPFHGDCLEGLASGPAIVARAGGRPGDAIADDDPLWVPVADALAGGFAILMQTLAPDRILIGGGVAVNRPALLPAIRRGMLAKLAGYLPFVTADTIDAQVRLAGLGDRAGPLGALALAQIALDERAPG